jgi:hypothetical protein
MARSTEDFLLSTHSVKILTKPSPLQLGQYCTELFLPINGFYTVGKTMFIAVWYGIAGRQSYGLFLCSSCQRAVFLKQFHLKDINVKRKIVYVFKILYFQEEFKKLIKNITGRSGENLLKPGIS